MQGNQLTLSCATLTISHQDPTTIGIRPLYYRILNRLIDEGWFIGPDTDMGKGESQPVVWGWRTAIGHCRDLHMAVRLNHHHGEKKNPNGNIVFEFYQNLVLDKGREKQKNGGRWGFNQKDRMPIHVRAHWQGTVNRIAAFLVAEHRYTFSDRWGDDRGKGMTWLAGHMVGWKYHTPKDYDPFTFGTSDERNRRSADKVLLEPGQRVFYYDYNKRLRTGLAFYSLNQSWVVVTNENTRPEVKMCSDLYTCHNSLPRRQRLNPQQQFDKIGLVKQAAVKAENWSRCLLLQRIQFDLGAAILTAKLPPTNCPLCSKPNGCQLFTESRTAPCWCRAQTFPPELVARAPTFNACICLGCLKDSVSQTANEAALKKERD